MKSTDDADRAAQYSHLLSCQLCRMHCTSVDFHPSNGWDCSFSFDLMLEPLQECFLTRYSSEPKFNNAPLVDRRYNVDVSGGINIVPGKSSHSTFRVPGSSVVKFREGAGESAANCFLLFKLISNVPAGKGAFFARIKSFYKDADIIIDALKRFQPNVIPLAHFQKAVKMLKVYCRKAPRNLAAEEKLSVCGLKLYNLIYNDSKIAFCTACSDCTVNKDIMQILECVIKMFLAMTNPPSTKLSTIFGADVMETFLKNCDVTATHATLKTNQNFIFPLSIIQ